MNSPFPTAKDLTACQGVMRASFRYTCTITRPSYPARDEFNQPVKLGEMTVAIEKPCQFIQRDRSSDTGEKINVDRAFVAYEYKLLLPYGTDVQVTDRIKNVRDIEGNPVDPSVHYFNVRQIKQFDTHVSLVLEKAS